MGQNHVSSVQFCPWECRLGGRRGQEAVSSLTNILSLESPQSVVLPNHDLNRAVFRHRHRINLSAPNSAALGFPEAAFLLGAKETNKALPSQVKGEGGGASSRTQKLK